MCCIPGGNIIAGMYKPIPIDIIYVKTYETISPFNESYIISSIKIQRIDGRKGT